MKSPNKLELSPTLIAILPSLALIPILVEVLKDIHFGGISSLISFSIAFVNPSLDAIVLRSSWQALQITIGVSLLSWTISTILGLLFGIISSNIFWETLNLGNKIPKYLRVLLSIPRAIHELIWGLILQSFFGFSSIIAIIAIIIPYSSLVAKVLRDQIDDTDKESLIALTSSGVSPLSALVSSIAPAIFPIFNSYIGYRLECALRGATLLGIFGLGGIGNEIQLTFQSLAFNEMWTSLWMLGITMLILEKCTKRIRINLSPRNRDNIPFNNIIIIFIVSLITSFILLKINNIELFTSLNFHPINFSLNNSLGQEIKGLDLISITFQTILITIFATGISIGIPPLSMMIWPSKFSIFIQNFFWIFARLIPPPIIALLLMLFSKPSIGIAALALGIHNSGIMGRLLHESINDHNKDLYKSVQSAGVSKNISWLYGKLSLQSTRYLSYGAYRSEVILRETALVGMVGGVGLGWQLQESLTSFAWVQVSILISIYILVTIILEVIIDKLRSYWKSQK